MGLQPSNNLPDKKMFLRSPFWVTKNRTNLDYIIVSMWIWTGDVITDEPTDPTLELRSTAFEGTAAIDVAEFARDQVEILFDGNQESNVVWVKTQVYYVDTDGTTTGTDAAEYYAGLDGFSYFEEGKNYQYTGNILMGTDRVKSAEGERYNVPVFTEKLVSWGLQNYQAPNWVQYHTVSGLTPTTDSADYVEYIPNTAGNVYAQRLQLNFDDGAGGTTNEYVYFDYEDCYQYGPVSLYFANRFGAIQQLVCFGRIDVSMSTQDEKFKRSIVQYDGSYDEKRHQNKVLYKNGQIKIRLNTGFYEESYNDLFSELMLSEQIWVKVEGTDLGFGFSPEQRNSSIIFPCNLTSQEFQMKKLRADKLISYTFDFEAAADRINSVR